MKNFLKNYGFMILMILGIVAGCIVGLIFPQITEGENATQGTKVLALLIAAQLHCLHTLLLILGGRQREHSKRQMPLDPQTPRPTPEPDPTQ